MENIFQIVASHAEKPLATKSELAELKRLQNEWEVARDTMSRCGIDCAYCAFIDHQTKLALAVRASKVHDHVARSREDFEQDYLQKADSAKQVMREICSTAAPITRKIAER